MSHQTMWILALAMAGMAAFTDLKSRRIPNWLTLGGCCVGLLGNGLLLGWPGLKSGTAGAAAMFLVLLPVVLLRGLGAGDWKLMGALGATLGLRPVVLVLLLAILLSALMALAQMIWQRRFRETLANLWELLRGYFVYGLRPHPEIQIGNPRAASLPFGVAAATATLICYGIGVTRL
jgi:prepilin peptidase CpaA